MTLFIRCGQSFAVVIAASRAPARRVGMNGGARSHAPCLMVRCARPWATTTTTTPIPTTNNGEAGYWRMQNGYLLPARRGGLSKLAERLRDIEKSQVKLKKARVAAFPPRRATNAQAP